MSNYRQERLDAIKAILKEGNISTQADLVSKLGERGFHTTQGTISKDLKYLKIYEKDFENGYVKTEEKNTDELKEIVSRLISYANPTFKLIYTKETNMSILYIFPKEGLESSISELISVFYKDMIISTVGGNGCVTVNLNNRKLGRELKKELEEYASMVF